MIAAILTLLASQIADAQTYTNDLGQALTQQTIQTIPKEIVQELKKQLMEELKKELIDEIKREFALTTRPQAQHAINNLQGNLNSGALSNILSAIAGGGKQNSQLLASLARQFLRTSQTAPTGSFMGEKSSSGKTGNGDLVAIVTNNDNPVKTLSMNDVRRLYSGEYKNWSQVGGPDLPVKVIVCSDSVDGLQNVLGTPSSDAVKLTYVSLIVPAVDRIQGALGVLPTAGVEQLQFVTGHRHLRKLAVKPDDESPAVAPSLATLKDGTYPVVEGRAWMRHVDAGESAPKISMRGM